MQLTLPNNNLVGPGTFNRLFTMHGTSMVFLFGMPMIAGLMNYLVPLMIGARDMAFPRLNAFGFWMFFFGGVLLYSSYLTAPGLDRGRFGSGCGLVRLFAADRPRFLTREVARTTGFWACSSVVSAASFRPLTSSSPSSACGAKA